MSVFVLIVIAWIAAIAVVSCELIHTGHWIAGLLVGLFLLCLKLKVTK